MAKTKRKGRYQNLYRKFPKKMQIKLVGVFAAIILAFVFFVGRAAFINIVNGKEYKKQVMSQIRNTGQTIPFKRGDILDTNGKKTATSERTYNVFQDVERLLTTEKKNKNKRYDDTVDALCEECVNGEHQCIE